MPEHLELPRPLRLLWTAGWSLTESAGFPLAAFAITAWLDGRNAGLIAGVVAIWLTALVRKIVTGTVPGLLTISATVLTLNTAVVIATGNIWIFLLHFPVGNLVMCLLFARTARSSNPLVAQLASEIVALRLPGSHHPGLHRFFQRATWLWAGIFLALAGVLGVLLVTEKLATFLVLSSVATIALVAVGTCASALWFATVLRKTGLRLRFAPA
jgi:uncharacterized membrane protein